MKTKRRNRSVGNKAQVGIGTMIVFIATVLVAAIAAGVLIDTSGKLQERSSRTGNEVTKQVASNLHVVTVQGKRDTTAETTLSGLNITLSLAPGADTVDMQQLRIQINNGTALKTIAHSTGASGDGTFNTTSFRDADSSFTASTPVMTAGDLVSVNVNLTANGVNLPARKAMSIVLIPEIGSPIRADFTAPESFGSALVIDLR